MTIPEPSLKRKRMVERESLSSWDRYRARSSIALLIRSVDSIRLLYTTLHATKSNLQQIIGARCPSYGFGVIRLSA